MNKVVLSREILGELIEIGKKTYPSEGCAVLLGSSENSEINKVKELNNSVRKELSNIFFQVDPEEILKIEKEGVYIAGFFHTHPDNRAVLSREDEEYMIPGLMYIVMSIIKGNFVEVRAYVKDPDCGGIREYDI